MTEPLFPNPVAHRGLHDRASGVIENSASAFEAAIIAGFAIECDVQLTSDGVPVIFHDNDMKRRTQAPTRHHRHAIAGPCRCRGPEIL